MAESLSVVRRDIAKRDVSGVTYIVAGGLLFDGPNNRIKVGADITLDGSTTKITVGSGANAIVLDGPNGLIEVGTSNLVLDAVNRRMLAIDDSAVNRVLIDGATGKIKVSRSGVNVLTATTADLILSSDFSYVRETWLQMHPQWDNSWTQNDAYTDVTGSLNSINFSDWPDHTWYFEMIGKTDDGTGSYQLYNNTTAGAISGSEVTTTSTSATRLRSGVCTKPSGTNVIKIQHKQTGGGGTGYVNSIMSRTVFRID